MGRPRVGRSAENIERVRAAVRRTPRRSIRKHAVALTLSKSTVHTILQKDLKFHPYKIQIVQALKVEDYPIRVAFAQHMLQNFNNFDNILFSDEAHFHLNGAVNKQNCRYWGDNNPREKHQQPLHSPKVTVWAAMSAHGIIGPFFLEDGNHRTVTVNSNHYRAMLKNFLEPELQNFAGYNQNTWFQQDGADCSHCESFHAARSFEACFQERSYRKMVLTSPMFFFFCGGSSKQRCTLKFLQI
ncbi:unnamed protein product [Psylliodes chrysocephalus]|uniref:Transposase n=1 Tax=Psylliodes chrysocephalus TaxID=3402493 RepID=A0A9P0D4T0_9CUCU|nr:unnamed protein product [Psylliodes chrysocephala]